MNHSKYQRIDGHVHLDEMQKKTVCFVGVGASSFLIENLARLGIGRVILIDIDTIESKNLTSQNWQNDDCGSYKVHALARRLEKVKLEEYPLEVITFPQSFTDVIGNEDFLRLMDYPKDTLILAMTDNFFVQDAVHTFAKSNGITIFMTGNYVGGGCGEIAIIDPDYPQNSCFKCMVPSRYQMMNERRNRGEDGIGHSNGSPFATGIIHHIMGHLILDKLNSAVIQTKTYEKVMREGRNFIQVKLQTDFGTGTPDWGSFNGDGMVNFLTLFHKMEKCCFDCFPTT